MKSFVLFGAFFLIALVAGSVSAQTTVITFAKGTSSKTITVTVPAKSEKEFSLSVNAEQVINIGVSGDIGVSKTNTFPVISLNLINGEDGVDQTQDGEGYLSILTGRKGKYIFSVSNSSNRSRTFSMKVAVTSNREDFLGGTDPE